MGHFVASHSGHFGPGRGGYPPCVTFHRVVAPFRGPGQSPVLPFACKPPPPTVDGHSKTSLGPGVPNLHLISARTPEHTLDPNAQTVRAQPWAPGAPVAEPRAKPQVCAMRVRPDTLRTCPVACAGLRGARRDAAGVLGRLQGTCIHPPAERVRGDAGHDLEILATPADHALHLHALHGLQLGQVLLQQLRRA